MLKSGKEGLQSHIKAAAPHMIKLLTARDTNTRNAALEVLKDIEIHGKLNRDTSGHNRAKI
jgi:hypothetical protein